MKNLFLVLALTTSLATVAQTKKPVAKKTPPKLVKVVPASAALKNRLDTVSYALGVSLASFYAKQYGFTDLNTAMISQGVNDVFKKKKLAMTDEQVQLTLMMIQEPGLQGLVEKNVTEGEAYLAENKKKPGVKVTASGLQYEILRPGTGVKPTEKDTVEVHYAGSLTNGAKFDNSYDRGETISFPLNKVIKGWTEGVQLMSEGSKFRFVIPHNLGYGLNAMGDKIPGGSVLVFEVELIRVKKAQ